MSGPEPGCGDLPNLTGKLGSVHTAVCVLHCHSGRTTDMGCHRENAAGPPVRDVTSFRA